MATFQKFQPFVQALGRKLHNLHTDTLKVMLCLTAPVAGNAVKADLVEIGAGAGYTAGGTAVGGTSYSQSGGVATLAGSDVVFTAAAGDIGPFRYAVLYNDTAAADDLIGFWDYGSAETIEDGGTLTVDFGAAILTVT